MRYNYFNDAPPRPTGTRNIKDIVTPPQWKKLAERRAGLAQKIIAEKYDAATPATLKDIAEESDYSIATVCEIDQTLDESGVVDELGVRRPTRDGLIALLYTDREYEDICKFVQAAEWLESGIQIHDIAKSLGISDQTVRKVRERLLDAGVRLDIAERNKEIRGGARENSV